MKTQISALQKETNFWKSWADITSGSLVYWCTGEKQRALLFFLSYFSSSASPSLSLVDPCIWDHQSSRLYYYFSTTCLDFQPTQEIKSPPSPQFSPSSPSPIYSFLPNPISLFSLQYQSGRLLTSPPCPFFLRRNWFSGWIWNAAPQKPSGPADKP